ncbi:MAG: DUF3880 domain-containing protein [Agathobacter sp.]|nr:DUF3880 domain-containing protein [Agathobacter sp.]
MKILIYEWKAYSYKDIVCSFQKMGHEVFFISQPMKNYDVDDEFVALLRDELSKNRYDFVFTVNYFSLISNVCQETNTKYVVWTYDNPLISMYHKSVFNECNYIFTFDKTNYLEFKGMGVENIFHLPLATDALRMEETIGVQNDDKWLHEISFVGNMYERNTYNSLEHKLPEYLKGYFDAVIEAQLNISGGNIVEALLTNDILEELDKYFNLKKEKDSFSDLRLVFQTTVLGFKIAQEQRRRGIIELSKKFDVTVYSDSDLSEFIGVDKQGPCDYWSQLPLIFNRSKININMTIPNIKSGIPLRVWDVLGAGGFLLTNYQAEIGYYFEDGKDLVCYEDIGDLVEKADFYLKHEELRKSIALNGHEKVKKYHTYDERIKKMLNIIVS